MAIQTMNVPGFLHILPAYPQFYGYSRMLQVYLPILSFFLRENYFIMTEMCD